MIRSFLIALQFLTVFRFRTDLEESPSDLAASVGFYPLVGLVLGLALLGCAALARVFFPPLVMGFLVVLTLAVLTWGLHLDGLADTADGLLSHGDRERWLEIMKDSSIGAFGALALIFVVGLKVSLLAALPWPKAWPVLVLFPVWGRCSASLTACLSNYARTEGGLGRPFVDLAGTRELYLSAFTALLLSSVFMGVRGLIIALAAALFAVWWSWLGSGSWAA